MALQDSADPFPTGLENAAEESAWLAIALPKPDSGPNGPEVVGWLVSNVHWLMVTAWSGSVAARVRAAVVNKILEFMVGCSMNDSTRFPVDEWWRCNLDANGENSRNCQM